MILSGLDNIDFASLCGLGAVAKVYSREEVVSMASPFLGAVFGDKLGTLVNLIYEKYRLVEGGADISAAASFAKDMGDADKSLGWFDRKAIQVGGYVFKTLGTGAASVSDQLESAFKAMAADWSSKGLNIVLASSVAATQAPQQDQTTKQKLTGGTAAASTVSVPSGPPNYISVQQRQSPQRIILQKRMSVKEKNRLMWILGVGAAIFAISVGLLAAKSGE